jgi:phosphoglycerate dehydrogenase-like enzyme
MKKIPVLIVRNFKPVQLAQLDEFDEHIELVVERARTAAEVASALMNYPATEVLYTINAPHRWSPLWNTRWIQIHYAGADHIKFDSIPEGVTITTASGVNSTAVAEHVLALMLALRKQIPRMLELQREKSWQDLKTRWDTFSRPLLRGETMGILGYGAIGRAVARFAKALGMNVLAYKRDPTRTHDPGFCLPATGDPDGSIPDAFYGHEEFCELLGTSDVVVNTLPGTPETEKMIGEQAFAAMKSSTTFISVGRGKTVDQAALTEALATSRISAAGLDVFEEEPLPPTSALWHFDNVIISPHVGGLFSRYDDVAMNLFKDNLQRYINRQPLLNIIDRTLGY